MPAVSLPTALPLVSYESFIGDTILDAEPLDTIGRVGNYLYGNHKPPLVNICPINKTGNATRSWVFPVTPSADALTYTYWIWIWNNGGAAGSTLIAVQYNTTVSTAGWTSLYSTSISNTALDYGTANVEGWESLEITLPAAARYLKLTAGTIDTDSFQIQSFLMAPKRIGSTASGTKASLFCAYEDTMVTGPGGTIHTEIFDRTLRNVAAVLTDREQMVLSYVETLTSATYTHGTRLGSGKYQLTRNVLHGTTSILGQGGGSLTGATINIRARVADAGGTGVLTVGEVGGEAVVLDCDDTDNTDTIELQNDRPTFFATVTPAASAAASIRYITGHWTPGN